MGSPADQDRRSVRVAIVAAGLLIAQQVGGKATRDTLFLSSYDAVELPKVMVAAAVLSILAVLISSRLLARLGPTRVVPSALAASGLLFAGEFFLNAVDAALTAWVVYLHMAVFGAIVISGFWSVVNERFDPHTAKRQIGRIAGGSTFGGVVGGLLAERVGALVDVPTMLLVLSGLNLIAAGVVTRVDVRARRRPPDTSEPRGGLRILLATRYLRHLGALVILTAIFAALLDYTLKAEAAQGHAGDEAGLIQFFAIFYTVCSLATFVVQTGFSRRMLQKAGLGGTLAVLPLTVLATGVLAAALTRLWTVAVLKGGEFVLSNSLFRAGYELLYTPLPPAKKRPTKAIIDVALMRLGDAAGSGVVMLLLAVVPSFSTQAVIGAALLTAVTALWFVVRLDRGYVAQLAASLRTGALRLSDQDIVDATTRRTLVETTMALDREKLLAQIEELRQIGDADISASDTEAASSEELAEAVRVAETRLARSSQTPPEEIVQLSGALLGDDVEAARKALKRRPFDRRLVALAIPLLAHRDLGRDALRALRRIAGAAVGQLVDGLLDPGQPSAVRRRIPRVLRHCRDQRAADGLFAGLADPRFEVRYQCGLALAALAERAPDLRFSADEVFEAARRELVAGARSLRTDDAGFPDDTTDAAFVDGLVRRRVNRRLRHVFNVLGLTLDREATRLCLAAMSSDDRQLRGTALEYLDNVLPAGVWKALRPYLGADIRITHPPRPREEIVDEMLRSMDSLRIDREALKKA